VRALVVLAVAAASAAAAAAAAATAPPTPTRTILVDLLAKPAPRTLTIEGAGRRHAVALRGDALLLDGRPAALPIELSRAAWTLRLPDGQARRYPAALTLTAAPGRIAVRGHFDLEDYVAEVVASEAAPSTLPAALQALAVVVRSFALAPAAPHDGGARCDLAHCQVLAGRATGRQAAEARAAASATAGQVLRLADGRLAAAHFHAACGGQTADPRLAFGGDDGGSASVVDEGCPEAAWRAALTPAQVAGALRGGLARAGDPAAAAVGPALRAADLVASPGPGGWVVQVAAADGRWRLSGDAAARALDAAAGRGQVRSSRFTVADAGGQVVLRGRGHGHGVGLCQAGSARRARSGAAARAILAAYFPDATVGTLADAAR